MKRASIAASELPSDVRARLGLPTPRLLENADGALKSARRRRAGEDFESLLEQQHDAYRMQRKAIIRKNWPRTAGTPGHLMYVKGGAPCDFGGEAIVAGRLMPILFDAKGIGDKATYTHPPDQAHQVDDLIEFQSIGGIAFLLLRDSDRGIAYVVSDLSALRTLQQGKGIQLRRGATHYHPIVHPTDTAALWDWLGTLTAMVTVGRLVLPP